MKLLVRVLIGLVLLLLLVVGLALVFVDPIAKAAVESGGSHATGVDTRLESADVGVFSGHLALEGLTVANPPGFSAKPCVKLGHVRTDWENKTLLGGPIHVQELAVDGLVLDLEQNGGSSNVAAILDHAQSLSKAGSEGSGSSSGAARTLVVDHVSVKNVRAELHVTGVPVGAGDYAVDVPPIEIRDFRTDGTTSEIVGNLLAQILRQSLDGALKSGAGKFPDGLVKDLRGKLDAGLQKQLEHVQGELGKQAEKAAGKLGDILGGKKKP